MFDCVTGQVDTYFYRSLNCQDASKLMFNIPSGVCVPVPPIVNEIIGGGLVPHYAQVTVQFWNGLSTMYPIPYSML